MTFLLRRLNAINRTRAGARARNGLRFPASGIAFTGCFAVCLSLAGFLSVDFATAQTNVLRMGGGSIEVSTDPAGNQRLQVRHYRIGTADAQQDARVMREPEKVLRPEGPAPESVQAVRVSFPIEFADECIGAKTHPLAEFVHLRQYGFPAAPGEQGGIYTPITSRSRGSSNPWGMDMGSLSIKAGRSKWRTSRSG